MIKLILYSVTLFIFVLNITGCTLLLEEASDCELQEGASRCTVLENSCDGHFSKWRKDGEIKCSCCIETEENRKPYDEPIGRF